MFHRRRSADWLACSQHQPTSTLLGNEQVLGRARVMQLTTGAARFAPNPSAHLTTRES